MRSKISQSHSERGQRRAQRLRKPRGRRKHAQQLMPKASYGQPDGDKEVNAILFEQITAKHKTQSRSVGLRISADLDDREMWPTLFTVFHQTHAAETTLAEPILHTKSTLVRYPRTDTQRNRDPNSAWTHK